MNSVAKQAQTACPMNQPISPEQKPWTSARISTSACAASLLRSPMNAVPYVINDGKFCIRKMMPLRCVDRYDRQVGDHTCRIG